MKYLITSLLLFIFSFTVWAQTEEDPVKWTQETTKNGNLRI